MGLSKLRRSTLADANQQRPAVIFEKTYYQLYERVSAELAPQPQKAPPIKIIDATTIDLCAAVFPWAAFRRPKAGVYAALIVYLVLCYTKLLCNLSVTL